MRQANTPHSHKLVQSEGELIDLLLKEVTNASQPDLVIMAGHFMLFLDEAQGRLTPGIIEEQTSPMRERIARRVGIFPGYTWELGVRIAEKVAHRFEAIKFLLLINDWQYVSVDSGPASELRSAFYDRFTELPASYLPVLKRSGQFSERNMLTSRKHPIAYPETWLKYRFQKSADKLVKAGRLERRVLENGPNGGTEVSLVDENGDYKPLITCGVTGCAGEVTEMISEVYKANHRLMLIFAPGECFQPVKTGVDIALSLYGLSGMKIIIADPGGSGEMEPREIFSKLVNLAVFSS
ncbi:LPD16 domain-containing protein [Ralstonia solanacearum species complex bacterium KE056]|uniref:LPD16 domain-containing protein n=1 Tax=Ralstonia solanacearum species complex bacterium KE056 TaxID=3119585 RepID=UPI002FC3438F